MGQTEEGGGAGESRERGVCDGVMVEINPCLCGGASVRVVREAPFFARGCVHFVRGAKT
jgi:hypothetical protein